MSLPGDVAGARIQLCGRFCTPFRPFFALISAERCVDSFFISRSIKAGDFFAVSAQEAQGSRIGSDATAALLLLIKLATVKQPTQTHTHIHKKIRFWGNKERPFAAGRRSIVLWRSADLQLLPTCGDGHFFSMKKFGKKITTALPSGWWEKNG